MRKLHYLRRSLALFICPELALAERPVDAVGKVHRSAASRDASVATPDSELDLVRIGDLYAQHRGLTLSTVGTYAAGDGKFFARLLGGRSCTLRRASRLVAWFSENWPADLEWPRDIPRPPKSKKEAA